MKSVGIIGGADGPTAVLVASSVSPWVYVAVLGIVAIVAVALIALFKGRK